MKCIKILNCFLPAFDTCVVGLIAVGTGPVRPESDYLSGGLSFGIACGQHRSGCLTLSGGHCGLPWGLQGDPLSYDLVSYVVAAAIAGYVLRDKVMSEFNKDFRQQMKDYPKKNQTVLILDRMQESSHAAEQLSIEIGKLALLSPRAVSDSCCVNATQGCGINFNVKEIHTKGCVKTGVWLSNVSVVAAAALGVAFVEVLGSAFASRLVEYPGWL